MPTYQDADNIVPFVPEGDYTLTVTGMDSGISKGAKTAGSDQYKVELSVDGHGCIVRETLTDHPSCAWKIDCFLKSCGIRMPKGVVYELTTSKKHNMGDWNSRVESFPKIGDVGFVVNPLGFRCHAKLVVEDWVSKDQTKRGKQNRVAVFYTDRPALTPVAAPEEEEKPF